ncbi:MAG: alpha-mannosidase [Candidatus Hydrogenedentes bacterium]|nr:alpha-mannosidase [Candidatus Hydrogenedentota bacterium]
MNKKTRTAHVVSHTHWDYEWRYPIWETRLMLADFMDELVGLLESGAYPGFLLDGQVTPVLDYLGLRPAMTDRVKALIAGGKLQVGPWLTLPDEYPVDGEALIRNLLHGRRAAEALGGVFNVGYTPFGWGQTAQLPQIYAGFGIDVVMMGKRVGKHRAPQSEFLWRGPDGTELLTTRFGELGRQNFYFKVHLSALFGVDHEGPEWAYDWARGGVAYHRADTEQMEQDHFRLDAPDRWYPETITPEMAEAAWATTDESVLEHDRLLMNGCDYTAGQPMFPEMLARLNEVDADPDRQWIHTTMPEFVDLMRGSIDRASLAVVEGELRDGPAGPTSGNALTTRLHLKRLNKRAQNRLIRFAEPLAAVAALAGAPYPERPLRQAWEFLLTSHPHDSINGVTQDKTARDVAHRLDQVVELGDVVGNRAMQDLVRRIDMTPFRDEDVLIVAFNPLPYPRREVVEAWINMPDSAPRNRNWPADPAGLQMFDAAGAAVGTQCEGATAETYCVAELHTRAFPYNCLRHRVFFDTGAVPACGYKVFRAGAPGEAREEGVPFADSLARTGTLLTAPNVIENEALRVEMNPNGTFNLVDKNLSHTFAGLNYYEDRGEHGDYWINEWPMYDQAHTSLGCGARIWSEEAGPLQSTLVSEITMQLPQAGNKEQQRRGDALEGLTIRTAVTLRAGEEQVEVRVEFENRHEDHFLRAMFPTGLSGARYADAGGHFGVDRRPIRPQGPGPDLIWRDMGTQPHNTFVDVSDEGLSDRGVGLAFLSDGLTEYEVLDNDERTVALSLLRAVRNWICTETRVGSSFPSQKGGQCLGRHALRYALRPHAGDWREAGIPGAAERFNAGLRLVQTRNAGDAPGEPLPRGGASLFSVEGPDLRFAALKRAEDRPTFVVRVYNPTDEERAGTIRFAAPLARAWETNLNEERVRELELAAPGAVPITAAAHRIVTVEIEPQ